MKAQPQVCLLTSCRVLNSSMAKLCASAVHMRSAVPTTALAGKHRCREGKAVRGQGCCAAGTGRGLSQSSPLGSSQYTKPSTSTDSGFRDTDMNRTLTLPSRSNVGMHGHKHLIGLCCKGRCPVGCAVREGMQASGVLVEEVGLALRTRGIPSLSSQGERGHQGASLPADGCQIATSCQRLSLSLR